ncbi:hypothetical protein D9615_000126 [Tricholomella constricta]|uniref:Glutamyl-tRNA(Gln) amidotransferase subunit F, mitochondrial n=1 Tax=Tricholomella constricta TaxID=117010 RepID=A0A8H5MBU9_9AGAR|nr:hypothetical protein D9615_000126 [Tricholomella constricta]
MWAAQRCLRRPRHVAFVNAARPRRRLLHVKHETDECGIPLKPTWSVHELLSSYPKPILPSTTLTRLHELSALIPPAEGTLKHVELKEEMEELIRLVEAVKLVDTEGVHPTSHRAKDGDTPDQNLSSLEGEPSGGDLLRHASRTLDGFYIVDSDRKRF